MPFLRWCLLLAESASRFAAAAAASTTGEQQDRALGLLEPNPEMTRAQRRRQGLPLSISDSVESKAGGQKSEESQKLSGHTPQKLKQGHGRHPLQNRTLMTKLTAANATTTQQAVEAVGLGLDRRVNVLKNILIAWTITRARVANWCEENARGWSPGARRESYPF